MSTYTPPPILSSTWKTRRITSGARPSLTSYKSPWRTVQSKCASKYSYTCGIRGACMPPRSATILAPARCSAPLAPQKSSQYSGLRPVGWEQLDSYLPQNMLVCTLSALVYPWLCTVPGSRTAYSWTSAGVGFQKSTFRLGS